jgi:nucleoside-diphosphate-sugar epimerase
MRVLVLGANGFTARHLIPHLKQHSENEIYYSSLSAGDGANWLCCDLTVPSAVESLLKRVEPDQIYQLAGSFTNHYETDYLSNVVSSRNILESILKVNNDCRVLLVGSCAEYGSVRPEDNPVKEDHPLDPTSVYGLSKAYQSIMMRFYHNLHHCNVVMARPFNLLGRGISTKLFIGSLYEQIEAYKGGWISRIVLGNLRHRRDYIDIEQAVRYYDLIMRCGQAGEVYNVGSGTGIMIYDLLERIMKDNGLSMDIIEERPDNQTDKIDVKDLTANVAKIKSLATPVQRYVPE